MRLDAIAIGKNPPDDVNVVVGAMPSPLPMNIPNWSKILKDEYRDNNWYREKREGTDEREEKRKSEEKGERKENKKI